MRAARTALLLLAVVAVAVGCSSSGSDKGSATTTTAPKGSAIAGGTTTTVPQAGAECPDGSGTGRDSVIETHCGGTAGVQLTVGSQVVQLRGGDCVVDDAGLHLKAGALTDPKVPAAPKKDWVDLEIPAGGVNPTLVAIAGGASPEWVEVKVSVQPDNAGGTFEARTADGQMTASGTFSC